MENILNNGHELQIHSFIHSLWYNPSVSEALSDINKCVLLCKEKFGFTPNGFATPYFSNTKNIDEAISRSNFKYVSIKNGDSKVSFDSILKTYNIPVTIFCTDENYPVLEYFARQGYQSQKIVEKSLEYFINNSDKKFLSTFLHPRIEGVELFSEFSQLIEKLSNNFLMNKTFSELINS